MTYINTTPRTKISTDGVSGTHGTPSAVKPSLKAGKGEWAIGRENLKKCDQPGTPLSGIAAIQAANGVSEVFERTLNISEECLSVLNQAADLKKPVNKCADDVAAFHAYCAENNKTRPTQDNDSGYGGGNYS